MQEINAWLLSEQNFVKGVALYTRYGTNSFFKELLQSAGPTPYNIQKLSAELTKLAPASPAVQEAQHQVEPTVPQQITKVPEATTTKQSNSHDHALYLRYLERRDTVVRQLDRNMAALEFASDEGVLHQTAKQILKLHRTKQEIWGKIDHYLEHGSFEPVFVPEPPSRETKMQLIYQSISKAKKRLLDPNCKNPEKTEQLIKEKLQELEDIKGGTDAD